MSAALLRRAAAEMRAKAERCFQIEGGTGGMPCTRVEEHTPGRGCIYQSSAGSDVDDKHADGGHG